MRALLALTLLLICSCTARRDAAGDSHTPADRRYTSEYIKKISFTKPQEALSLLDVAERKGYMDRIDLLALRSMIYNNATQEYGKAVACAVEALDDPDISKYPDKEARLINMATTEYYSMGQYGKCLTLVSRGLDFADKRDDKKLLAQLLLTMAQCHAEVGNTRHALEAYERSTAAFSEIVRNDPSWENINDLIIARAQQSNTLLDAHEYKTLFAIRPDYERMLQRLQSLTQDITDTDDRSWAAYYAIYALAYEDTGDHAEGRRMFDRLMTTRIAQSSQGSTFVVPYLLLTRRYAEALSLVTTEQREYLASGRDTIDYYYTRGLLMNRAKALQALGRYKEAIADAMTSFNLSDSLDRRVRNQNATWMSEQLGNKMLTLHIDKQERALRMGKSVIIVVTTLLVILLMLVARIIYDNRVIRKKNRAASLLISDLTVYKDRLFHMMSTQAQANSDDETDDEHDRESFLAVEKRIFDDRLFLQPKLSREEVADLMGMSLNRLTQLFTRYCPEGFTNYINDLRLEYAARLLRTCPNYSVEAVAQDCGLPVRQTFYRLFAKKYGITPTEYRNSMTGED